MPARTDHIVRRRVPEQSPYVTREHPDGVELCRAVRNQFGHLVFKPEGVFRSEREAVEEILRRNQEKTTYNDGYYPPVRGGQQPFSVEDD